MITRTFSRWLMSIALAVCTLIAINFLVATSSVQGKHAATLINCSGSIQACIDAANDGDTILIAAGRYTESLTLSKAVSLTGENRDTTIIHAVAGQRVLTVTGATISNSVVISGLTFTGGSADIGGGMLITDTAQPLIRDSIFSSNTAQIGGGLYSSNAVTVINTDFISNTATFVGGGVHAFGEPVIITGGRFEGNTAIANGGLSAGGTVTLTNVDFIRNTASTDAGGARIGPGTISGGRFIENTAGSSAGGLLVTWGAVVTGTRFLSNTTTGTGGGLLAMVGTVLIMNADFENNYAGGTTGGGGLAIADTDVTLVNTRFISNTANGEGGGVRVNTNCAARISGSRFERNTAAHGGGGLYAGFATTSDTEFISNSTMYKGGAVYASYSYISDSRFVSNTAFMDGGGLYSSNPISLTHSEFINNRADNGGGGGDGGGAYISGNVSVIDSHFEQNVSKGNANDLGGGMYVDGEAVLSNVHFISNTAQYGGAGAFVKGATAYVNGSHFEGNISDGYYAGGIFAPRLYLTDTVFIANSSQNAGGGAQSLSAHVFGGRFERNSSVVGGGLSTDSLFVSGTQFISNTATPGGGGGVWVSAMAPGDSITLISARFENNRALGSDPIWSNGGGLLAWFGPMLISDTQFISNSTSMNGGGLFYRGSANGQIINSVFAHNNASLSGAAIGSSSGGSLDLLHASVAATPLNPQAAIAILSSTLRVTNTIVASHTIAISNMGGTVYEDYNLFFNNLTNTLGVTSGGHSLVGDPRFVDPLHGDYHLQFGSAAIDRGVDAGVYTDLDGNPRPIGLGFDIGAYEYGATTYRTYLPIMLK